MQLRKFGLLIVVFIITACVSIPKETVTLSKTLGSDLKVLHNSHRNLVEIYFSKIKNDIHSFVDDVYAPFVIHNVLKSELESYKKGNRSIYGIIEIAGQQEGKEEAENALNEMNDFQKSAYNQINEKRKELITPILIQEAEVLSAINQSYKNVIYANSTITGYLESIRKVKKAQQEALSMVGLAGLDTLVTNNLIKVSNGVDQAVQIGKEIDIQSDKAKDQIEEISNKIKALTNNNK